MVIKGLQKFFASCPHLSKKRVNVNFLDYNEGAVSIEPMGSFSVIKKYCDGKSVVKQDFSLSVRCGFDSNLTLNLKDAELLENICHWIGEQNSIANLPTLSDGFSALDISVTKMPHLYESSVQGARMQVHFSLTYKEI